MFELFCRSARSITRVLFWTYLFISVYLARTSRVYILVSDVINQEPNQILNDVEMASFRRICLGRPTHTYTHILPLRADDVSFLRRKLIKDKKRERQQKLNARGVLRSLGFAQCKSIRCTASLRVKLTMLSARPSCEIQIPNRV